MADGYYSLEVAKIAKKLRKAQYHEYRHEQRRYYYCLLQDVLLSRKKLLEAAAELPPGVPVKMEQLQSSDKAYTTARIEDRTKRRYFKYDIFFFFRGHGQSHFITKFILVAHHP